MANRQNLKDLPHKYSIINKVMEFGDKKTKENAV